MNRKGFTLIEVLAVIVILGIILVIAGPSVLEAYDDSKLKSEEIFTERLSQSIDSYIKLNSSDIDFTSDGTANKTDNGSTYQVEIYRGKINKEAINRSVKVSDVINSNLLSSDDYVNPGNKESSCNIFSDIEVYRDSDYIYCYKVKKDSLDCLTDRYKDSITGEYVIDTCVWSK